MNEPKQPEDHPPVEEGAHRKDTGPTHGIPHGVQDAEPKGSPNSDRQQTETAADPAKQG